jgi:hypothetical protein
MLAVAAAAVEAAGCQVIGTATSGQAARNLGDKADLGQSRTLASLLWRLEHNRISLDEHSVVILDEAGMTEDAQLVGLTAHIEAAGAKLVVVGDHHQLGAVGPGGANVAALNQRARAWMEATGRLSGPELVCPGGHAYRAGDHVIALASGPNGSMVTSQRATIQAVDLSQETLTVRTEDGHHVLVRKEEAGADRLGYGYATTVHRAQGATVGRAHLFADGGGRELAYVAMSRARESTEVWAVADDLPQAVDDLRRDWSTRRTPTWAIDTTLPDPATLSASRFQELPHHQQARLVARFHAEQAIAGQAIAAIRLPDRAATLGQVEQALKAAHQARRELETCRGVWADTAAGRAVRDVAEARAAHQRAAETAAHGARWRDRRVARKQAADWAKRETDAEQRWAAHVAPSIVLLDQDIARHQATLERTADRFDRREASCGAVISHALDGQRYARNLAGQLREYRDKIDSVPSAAEIRRAATLIDQQRPVRRVIDSDPPLTGEAVPEL